MLDVARVNASTVAVILLNKGFFLNKNITNPFKLTWELANTLVNKPQFQYHILYYNGLQAAAQQSI